MSERAAACLEVYTDIETVVAYGLAQQHVINCIADGDDRNDAMQGLVGDMDQAWRYFGAGMGVTGDMVQETLLLAPGADIDHLDDASNSGYRVSPNQTMTGNSVGFGFREVPLQLDNGEVIGSRLALCYVLDLGTIRARLHEDDTITTVQSAAYFTLEGSEMWLLGKGLEHNIAALRRSADKLYGKLDVAVYSETASLRRKLAAVYDALHKHNFGGLPEREQDQILSYINSFELPVPPQKLAATYVLQTDGGTDMVVPMNNEPVWTVFEEFERTGYYRFRAGCGDKSDAVEPAGVGVGIRVRMYRGGTRYDAVVPLNQQLHFPGRKRARAVASAALAA